MSKNTDIRTCWQNVHLYFLPRVAIRKRTCTSSNIKFYKTTELKNAVSKHARFLLLPRFELIRGLI